MTWTLFWDMHSGGGSKEKFEKLFIEAPQKEAVRVFYARYGHNPYRVTCTCCGDDYAVSEHETLEQATAFHRNCEYVYVRSDGTECPQEEAFVPGKGVKKGYKGAYVERRTTKYDKYGGNPAHHPYISVQEFINQDDVEVIRATEIKSHERHGDDPPQQGYVWAG